MFYSPKLVYREHIYHIIAYYNNIVNFLLFSNSVILHTMITREEIDNLCTLSRIGATDAEKDALQKDLENILGYVQQVADIEVPADTKPLYAVANVMRADADPYPPKTFTDKLLDQAPARDGDFVKVQKVL